MLVDNGIGRFLRLIGQGRRLQFQINAETVNIAVTLH